LPGQRPSSMANDKYEVLPKDKDLAKQVIDNRHQQTAMEIGKLGQFFGTEHAGQNIAGALILILALFGVGYTVFCEGRAFSVKDMWSVISPMITLALGYVFGVKAGVPRT